MCSARRHDALQSFGLSLCLWCGVTLSSQLELWP